MFTTLQGVEPETDPEKESSVSAMINLWNSLAKNFVSDEKVVNNLGLCDLDVGVFKRLYDQAEIKPSSVQVEQLISLAQNRNLF